MDNNTAKIEAVRETPRLDQMVNMLQEQVARANSSSNHLRTMVIRLGGSWPEPEDAIGQDKAQEDNTLNNLSGTIEDLNRQISHIDESLQNLGKLV